MTRTYGRADWLAAQASWDGFSPEWREIRHVMAMQGVIYAPSGTELDSWEEDSPSQRAILIRAIRETPALLGRCARGATSWSQLVDRLTRASDDRRDRQRIAERDRQADADAARVPHAEAAASLASILRRADRRLLFRELKSDSGRLTPRQAAVLELLSACGQDAGTWRPSDLASGRVEAELR